MGFCGTFHILPIVYNPKLRSLVWVSSCLDTLLLTSWKVRNEGGQKKDPARAILAQPATSWPNNWQKLTSAEAITTQGTPAQLTNPQHDFSKTMSGLFSFMSIADWYTNTVLYTEYHLTLTTAIQVRVTHIIIYGEEYVLFCLTREFQQGHSLLMVNSISQCPSQLCMAMEVIPYKELEEWKWCCNFGPHCLKESPYP